MIHAYCLDLVTKEKYLPQRGFDTVLSKLNTAPLMTCIKGKAIPLQAWTGPEGSRGLRLPDFNDHRVPAG